MQTTTNTPAQKRPMGRPPIPFDVKKSPLRLFLKNALIRRFEQAAPNFLTVHSEFAEMVIERGLDSLEHDQTLPSQYGTNLDHAITYSQLSE